MRILFLSCAAATALAACSAPDAGENAIDDPTETNVVVPPDETAPLPETEADAPADPAGETTGGDGSALVLSPLQPNDGADLQGELACSFATTRGGTPVFVGKGFSGVDERPQAAIRIGDYAERLMGAEPGGFGYLTRGGKYAGRGMTITITLGDEIDTGHEGSLHNATLLAQRGDGAERSWEGFYSCGP